MNYIELAVGEGPYSPAVKAYVSPHDISAIISPRPDAPLSGTQVLLYSGEKLLVMQPPEEVLRLISESTNSRVKVTKGLGPAQCQTSGSNSITIQTAGDIKVGCE